ncbi:MAG: helicase C-terminal domain-containing protein [Actinomycetota bacterium]|nr:helicase C-terminal domain-containing protein [Actinomycetota bacterium]
MSADRPRTLSEWLRGQSDEWLAALLQARPDLAVPVPADLGVLASRIGIRVSIGRALEDLDAFTLQVLDALLLAERTSSYAAVRRLLPPDVSDQTLRDALDRLRALVLAWGPDEEIHLVVGVRELVGAYPAGLGHPTGDLLRTLNDAEVATILRTLDLGEQRQPGATTAIASRFADPAWLADLLDRCGPAAREVLGQLTEGPPLGSLPGAQAMLAAGREDSPIRWLLARGLLVAVGPDTVELPREVALALRGGDPLGPSREQPPAVHGTTHDPAVVDGTAGGQVLIALRRVQSVLELVGVETPAVLRSGGLGIRELRRLAKALDLTTEDLALSLELSYAAGLLDHTSHVNATWQPTRTFDKWLVTSPEQRWAVLAAAWLSMSTWPAFVGERDDRDKPINALSYETSRMWAAPVRRRVLAVLTDQAPGTAVAAREVVEQLGWRTPRRAALGRIEVVEAVLAEAESLGLLGRGALSAAGRQLLAGGDAAAALARTLPEPVEHVLIQADLTVIAPGPLAPELAREIALVADVESSGGATVYRIDERTVRRALDAGRGAADLHELFESRSRTPVPQALRYLIDDVARRHGRLRVGPATAYLRCDDESVLAEVVADRRTAAAGLRRIAPTVVLSTAPVGQVLEVLRGAGYAPVAEDPAGAVVISRAEGKRLPARSAATRYGPAVPTGPQLIEAVRRIRAGDEASRTARRSPVTTRVPGVTTAGILEVLQKADDEDRDVWMGYLDAHGTPSQRVVQVAGIAGGFLEAFDLGAHGHRTFALERITSAALLDMAD